MRIAVAGTGPLAAQWAVRFLARGWDVVVADPAVPALAAALWHDSQLLGHFPGASLDRLTVGSLTDADAIHALGGPVVGTEPVHVIPLVEVTSPDAPVERYIDAGMVPVNVRASTAHLPALARIAALQEAVVDPDDAQRAIEHGPALQVLAGSSDAGAIAAVMRSLRPFAKGAGVLVAEWEARRYADGALRWEPGAAVPTPLDFYRCRVEPDWVDYNAHMTEAAYLTAFGWASDALFRYVGDDEAYRAGGHSFYTVETHINYLQECSVNDPLRFTTQVLGVDHKRLWFRHEMYHDATGELLATTEQMLVHVDMHAGRSAAILPDVRAALDAVLAAHSAVPTPATAGCLSMPSPAARSAHVSSGGRPSAGTLPQPASRAASSTETIETPTEMPASQATSPHQTPEPT